MPIPNQIVWGPTLLGIGIALLLFGMVGRNTNLEASSPRYPGRSESSASEVMKFTYSMERILLLLVNYLKSLDFDLVALVLASVSASVRTDLRSHWRAHREILERTGE